MDKLGDNISGYFVPKNNEQGEFNSEFPNNSAEIQNSENVIGEDKIKLDYFERAKSEDLILKQLDGFVAI